MTIIPITALNNPTEAQRDDSGPGDTFQPGTRSSAGIPDSRPAPDPIVAFVELCRVEFNRRWHEDQFGYGRPPVAMPDERVGDVRPAQ